MNELLQKHGCANVFTIPEGLRELMADISREVLRDQPPKIYDYIANYLSVLLITREHGILAVKLLDDLCDCRPSVSEHLMTYGLEKSKADALSQIIKEEIEGAEPVDGNETVKETQILKRVLAKAVLDEEMAAKVCQVARNAYRDYWYRKKLMEKNLKAHSSEPWEIAAERTLELYKRTKPSYSELTRAAEKIQAAYRGYHTRRNTLRHLKPKPKKSGAKVDLPGPPVDAADSREIDLGPVIDIHVRELDTTDMFNEVEEKKLKILKYDSMKKITHNEDLDEIPKKVDKTRSSKFEDPKPIKFEEPKPMQLDKAKSRSNTGEEIAPEQRKLRMSSNLPTMSESRSTRPVGSKHSSVRTNSQPKISFVHSPVRLEKSLVIPEEIQDEPEKPEAFEVTEELIAPMTMQHKRHYPKPSEIDDDTQEVPEDIPDEPTEGDETIRTASATSSAPGTVTSTDVEDYDENEILEDENE